MNKPKFTIGAFAVIFDKEKRVLLCRRRDYDLWNLPGGTVEHGECPWSAVIREVKEETGFDVEIEKLQGIYVKEKDMVFSFLAKIIGGDLSLNDEADKIEYFAFDKLPKNTANKQVQRIKDSLEKPNDLTMKYQEGKSSIQLLKEGKSL